jgi:hypothetical protein
MDSKLKRIADGNGLLERSVAPGIYKVRFRSGSALSDRLIEVPAGGKEVALEGEAVPFATAAPLSHTRDWQEDQASAAELQSGSASKAADRRSEVFVFVRDTKVGPWAPPAVRLHDVEGALVIGLAGAPSNASERWSAGRAGVAPGTYRIQVDTGSLGTFEMFAFASEGWQTQVFLAYGEIRERDVTLRAPRLRTASVLMAPLGQGFRAHERSAREADLLRLALASGRNVLSDRLRKSLLDDSPFDPMLGIYAGHMEVAQRRPDHKWLRRLLARLRKTLPGHPDVEALALYRPADDGAALRPAKDPPMLRSSWRLIAATSRRSRELVEPGSPLDRVAEHVLSSGPWLLSRVPDSTAQAALAPRPRERRELDLGELAKRVARPDAPREELETLWQATESLSPFEADLLQTIRTMVQQGGGSLPKRSRLASDLSRKLNVPLGSVERVVGRLDAAVRAIEDRK